MPPASFVTIRLEPLGEVFKLERGAALRDILFQHGVEFPCGGRGRCMRCRVRVLRGELPSTPEEEQILGPRDIAEGWRLACRSSAYADVTLDIAQWEAPILADETAFAFTPRSGLGIAVDLGTTTLVAQLLDLETGHVLGVGTALNPQAAHGSDVMSRVHMAVAEGGLARLTALIREGIGALIRGFPQAPLEEKPVCEVVLVGNTVMHHLFCGIDPEPLSHYPFDPACDGLQSFQAQELGWEIPGDPLVQFLPCLGGFVGSDILAGILAAGLLGSEAPAGLLDLGTNGEIVFGDRAGLLCASTAAGPAFEGGRISMGMRASTGAITEVSLEDGNLRCHVLGNVTARGICGSGLVDAVAAGLQSGMIASSGRFTGGAKEWPLAGGVKLLQRDVRELQLAKGAIAAGIRILLRQSGTKEAPGKVYLAGAFGNYVSHASARRVGLLDFPPEAVAPAGNTALLGAKLALFRTEPEERHFDELRRKVRHVRLAADPAFEDTYVDSMRFPEGY